MKIEERYKWIRERIGKSAMESGRDEQEVTLIAVSKTQPVDAIQSLYDLGHRDFGENRLQEILEKMPKLPEDIRWHYIGTLQSKKVRKAAEVCSILHSIDSYSQLREIEKLDRPIDVLIQVNIGEEEQKSGIDVKTLDEFHQAVLHCTQAKLLGLMTIGPIVEVAENMRPYFAEMRRLNEQIGGQWLSMGMSGDFEVAIQEGATHIRVGSLLFGERQ
jgi:PLP dependent protein